MSQKIEIATAIGTIGCVLGIGLLMQSSEVAELRYGTPDITAYPATTSQTGLYRPIQVASMTLTSAGPDTLIGQNPADILGAAYGDPNHVWAGAVQDDSAMPLGNGYLTVLGNSALSNPQHAEIYTFPNASDLLQPDVELSIDAEVTAANCGQDAQSQAQEFHKGKHISIQRLSLAVPG